MITDLADLKPYPAMTPSGVEWLGEMPEHWELRRLAQIGRLSKGNGGNKDDEVPMGVPCVRYGDLYTTHTYFIRKSRSFVSQSTAEGYTPIKFGDVLFAASGETFDEIGKSAVNLMQSEGCCGGDVILFRPERRLEARYMGYATDCRPAAAQKATMGRGITVKHIYGDQLKYLTLAVPPLPEQAIIVRYLDHADRRIQRYIRAKQKLVTLLEEQKQAIIHQAVTGKVDIRTGQPYPAYKPSGVEWLGEVPKHWEMQRLRNTSEMRVSNVDKHTKDEEQPVRLCNYVDVYKNDRIRSGMAFMRATATTDEIERFRLRSGDVLITKDSEAWNDIGVPALVEDTQDDIVSGYHLALLRPFLERVDGGFLFRALQSTAVAYQFHVEANGVTRYGLSHSAIKSVWLPLPPLAEQAAIVRYLDKATADTDSAIDRARRQIELLREYSTRLIADVVTGKLDVREAAARLPDEVEEPEPLDETDALTEGEEEPTDDRDDATEEAAV